MPWGNGWGASSSRYGGWNRSGRGAWHQGGGASNGGGATATGSQWWGCQAAKCKANRKKHNHGPWQNHPNALVCDVCDTPKAGATTTPLKAQLQAALAGPGTGAGKSYLQAATGATAATQGAQVTVPKPAEDSTFFDEEMQEEPSTTLELPGEYTALARLLVDPLELNEEWTAEAVAQSFLPKQGQDHSKLEKELADFKTLQDLQVRKVVTATPTETAATKKKVETTLQRLEKAKADSAVALAACELEVSLKRHARVDEARCLRSDAAEVKAEESADRLEEICREQAAAWEAHLARLQGERSTREAA